MLLKNIYINVYFTKQTNKQTKKQCNEKHWIADLRNIQEFLGIQFFVPEYQRLISTYKKPTLKIKTQIA